MSKKFTPPKKSLKTTIEIAQLEQEKREAYKSRDKKRIEEVNKKLNYLYYGVEF